MILLVRKKESNTLEITIPLRKFLQKTCHHVHECLFSKKFILFFVVVVCLFYNLFEKFQLRANYDCVELEILMDHKFQGCHRRVRNGNLLRTLWFWPSALGNCIKRFAVQTLLWSLEFAIHQNLQHDTIPVQLI